jgi:hypothetical protein
VDGGGENGGKPSAWDCARIWHDFGCGEIFAERRQIRSNRLAGSTLRESEAPENEEGRNDLSWTWEEKERRQRNSGPAALL